MIDETIIKQLTEALTAATPHLKVLSVTALANTLYDAGEVKELIKQRMELKKADALAYDVMNDSSPRGKDWPDIVQALGSEDAARTAWEEAREKRVVTMRAFDAFEQSHPLIRDLMQMPFTVCDRFK